MVKVIGGTGLVGSHLLCELAKSETEIIASYRTRSKIDKVKKVFDFYFGEDSSGNWSKIKWQKVDVNDIVSLEDFINSGDEVYHCAALVSFSRKDFNQLMKINREGTTNIVNVCIDKNIKKLCYVSSTAAITGGDVDSVSEESKWKRSDDTSAYSISKYGAEREVWRGIEEGLTAVIVNPCVILGAGDWNESSLTILKQIERGLSFYPPGANAIVDARDIAKCMVNLTKSEVKSERFLLIGENTTFKSLFDQIAMAMGKNKPKFSVGLVGLTIARYLMGFWSFLRRKHTPITKDTVNSSLSTTVYSNDKIIKELNYTFFTLQDTIANALKGKIG
jgi:nucleoside-diphosphate-sugar epimerase